MKTLFILSLLFSFIVSENLIIVSTLEKVEYSCSNGILSISIDVAFNEKKDQNIPFTLEMAAPENLKMKCIIDFKVDKILCISSITNNFLILPQESKIEFPYKFPEIKGVVWEYDSFIRKIYRNVWPILTECGNPVALSDLNSNAELQAIIDDVFSGKCFALDKYYSFYMKIKMNGGRIKNEIEEAKSTNKNYIIQILHNITVPIFMGNITEDGDVLFSINEKYKNAECEFLNEINPENFNDENSMVMKCNIPLKGIEKLMGPIRIQPFSEYIYVNINSETQKILINFDLIKSTLIAVNPNTNTNENQRNLHLDDQKININDMVGNITKNRNFLLINGKQDIFICPDKPIFDIQDIDGDIRLKTVNLTQTTFDFVLKGYLSNLVIVENNKIMYLYTLQNDISFNLLMKNNLDEDPETNKHQAECLLKKNITIRKSRKVEILCTAKRPTNVYNNKNIDLSLNWNFEENNKFSDIIINWPNEAKSRNFFSYEITGLSFRKIDYGCFMNSFYFYFNIINLKHEPKIDFYLPLFIPRRYYATCKVFNTVTLKCAIDVRSKRLSKGQYIYLPREINNEMTNKQGNKVNFKLNLTFFDYFSNYLIVEEDCGDYFVVGTLKDAGFSFWQILATIIGIFLFVILLVFGGCFCIIYKITHRNRKGPYFKHVEENSGVNNGKPLPNTSKPNIVEK